MELHFDNALASGYHAKTQIARVLTEKWVADNMFCPRCGEAKIEHFANNKPVADFYCPRCKNEYELKSKSSAWGHKVNDGAYDTMIQRITSNKNPDFFLMNYSKEENIVVDFLFVPKHFFTPEIIEKRKPLAPTARRAGWVGCNILFDKIPVQGRVEIVSHGVSRDITEVVEKVNKSQTLETADIDERGWLFEVLNCVNTMPEVFTLKQLYQHEPEFLARHPRNHNVEPKIRQQLQILRDKGFLEFLGHGRYRKIV